MKPKNGNGGRPPRIAFAIERAMREIEHDIEEAEGLYPYNGGRLSQAEVCRRAGVTPASLHHPNHRLTTLAKMQKWIRAVHKRLAKGKRTVRKVVTQRADDLRDQLSEALTRLNVSRIEYAQLQAELDQARAELNAERAQCQGLREELRMRRAETGSQRGRLSAT